VRKVTCASERGDASSCLLHPSRTFPTLSLLSTLLFYLPISHTVHSSVSIPQVCHKRDGIFYIWCAASRAIQCYGYDAMLSNGLVLVQPRILSLA